MGYNVCGHLEETGGGKKEPEVEKQSWEAGTHDGGMEKPPKPRTATPTPRCVSRRLKSRPTGGKRLLTLLTGQVDTRAAWKLCVGRMQEADGLSLP